MFFHDMWYYIVLTHSISQDYSGIQPLVTSTQTSMRSHCHQQMSPLQLPPPLALSCARWGQSSQSRDIISCGVLQGNSGTGAAACCIAGCSCCLYCLFKLTSLFFYPIILMGVRSRRVYSCQNILF